MRGAFAAAWDVGRIVPKAREEFARHRPDRRTKEGPRATGAGPSHAQFRSAGEWVSHRLANPAFASPVGAAKLRSLRPFYGALAGRVKRSSCGLPLGKLYRRLDLQKSPDCDTRGAPRAFASVLTPKNADRPCANGDLGRNQRSGVMRASRAPRSKLQFSGSDAGVAQRTLVRRERSRRCTV